MGKDGVDFAGLQTIAYKQAYPSFLWGTSRETLLHLVINLLSSRVLGRHSSLFPYKLGNLYIALEEFENAASFLRLGLPSTIICH